MKKSTIQPDGGFELNKEINKSINTSVGTGIDTICICGGGGLGLVCAGVLASQGLRVNLLTGHPDKWSECVEVTDSDGKKFCGRLNAVSSNPEDVIPEAQMVLLCLPGYLIEKTLLDIRPYLAPDAYVGSIVGSTGFFFFAHEVLSAAQPLFAFQRVPFISRAAEYGKKGLLLGYKDSLNVAIENAGDDSGFTEFLSKVFLTPVARLGSFYEAALTNSNPLLHTSRLYTMWVDWKEGDYFTQQGYFYADWTLQASDLLIEMDREFMQLLDSLGLARHTIQPLLEYYESTDAQSLKEKISSIPAFKPILSPMVEKEPGKWVPDFSSRYFTEDFPFGLRFIKDLADKQGLHLPTINKVYEWGMGKVKKQ